MCRACGGPLANNKRRLCPFQVAFLYCRTLAIRDLRRSVNTAVNNGQKENREICRNPRQPGSLAFLFIYCFKDCRQFVQFQLNAELSRRSSIGVAHP